MAIAGWLIIGLAILLLVSVMNNSWPALASQFRGWLSGGAKGPTIQTPEGERPDPGGAGLPPVGSGGRVDTDEGPPLTLPSLTPLPLEPGPADIVVPGQPTGPVGA